MSRITVIVLFFLANFSFGQPLLGELTGNVIDEYGEPRMGVHVYIDDEFGQRYQAKTDFDGNFRISGIPVGAYDLNLRWLNDTLKGIQVDIPKYGFHNCGVIDFAYDEYTIVCCYFPTYPDIRVKEFEIVQIDYEILKEDVRRFDIPGAVGANVEGFFTDEWQQVSAFGSRQDDILYFVDGIKTRTEVQIPSASYDQIRGHNKGIPARFGDCNGAIIEIETLGYFDLYEDWLEATDIRGYIDYISD